MRIPGQLRQRSALSFNITPMIDVVFLLIIFFLVASMFVRHEQAVEVVLPLSRQGNRDAESTSSRITITVDSQGRLSIGGVFLSEDEVTDRLQQLMIQAGDGSSSPEVRIRSDQKAQYVHIRRLIEKCAAGNLRRIQFAVTAETANP